MASAIRASPAPVASSRRDARGGSLARVRSRAARIPRAARPAARADDGELLAQDDGDGPVGGGADARVGRAPSVSSATLAAVCASASLIFGAAHAIDADPALAVGTTTTSTDPQPSLAERDRRTASRMVDAFDALSREDKVRVVERLMFETESAMTERDDGGPGGAGDGDVRAPTPRGWGEAGSGRYPGAESKNDEDKKPDDDDDDDDENEARYAAAAARRRALLEPLASSSSSFSVDALREMDERDGWSTSNDDVPGSKPRRGETFFGGGQGASNKEPLDPLFGLFGGDDDDGVSETDPSSPSGMDGVFQKLFQWFREEGPVLTDLLNDPNARYRAGSLVLVGSLVLGTLTESRGASDVDGNVEGSNPVPAESSDSGDAVTRPETDDDDDAEDERGEEKTKKKTKKTKKKLFSPARAGADGVLWSRRDDDDDDAGIGGGPDPPAASPSGGGVLWTRAEAAGGVDGAARREGRRRRRGGAGGGRRMPLESSEGDEEGDRGGGDRFDRFEGDIGEERERRGTFARAPGGGSAPTSPPRAVIGPVEDENMEGFRLSGRGRTQR